MATPVSNSRMRDGRNKMANVRHSDSQENPGSSGKQLSITFEPTHLQRSKKQVPNDPIITFQLEAFSGTLKGEIMVPQSFFLGETRTSIPQVLDFDEGDKFEYNFRTLVNVSRRVKIDAQWEAFGYFVQWLHAGVYENIQIECTHIDAYILSKTLGSPRFGNAVMEVMLATMSMRKYDHNLTEAFHQIFQHCGVNCPLRILYFESAVYWKMTYGPGPKGNEHLATRGEGFLMLDELEDEVFIEVLQRYRWEFCPCAKDERERRVVAARRRSRSKDSRKASPECLDNRSVDGVCICKIAPWSRDCERFFIAT